MKRNSSKQRVLPAGTLQLVIRTDGSVGVVQRYSQAQPITLSLVEIQMIADISAGRIRDLDESADEYIAKSGLTPAQAESCRKVLRRLRWLQRIKEGEFNGRRPWRVALPSYRRIVDIPAGEIYLKTPIAFSPRHGKFQSTTHHGVALPPVSAVELHALSQLVKHHSLEAAWASHCQLAGDAALSRRRFSRLVRPFVAARFIDAKKQSLHTSAAEFGAKLLNGDSTGNLLAQFREHAAAQDAAEAAREAATGRRRPKVIPVTFDQAVPAGLGAIVAYARVHEDGALDEFYNFRTDWVWDPERLASFAAEPAIYLFSNYLWSHRQCIEVSQQIKALSPNSITIHGGPDTPKYEGDERRYFESYPHIDVTIRGEGEISAAQVLSKLRAVIGDDNPDLDVLRGVEGATYRSRDGVVRNPDRPRVKDLNTLPSAYLTGLFDAYIGAEDMFIILETNRGCPYGCTFCDWGSATASKIRQFDEERVMAEIAWAAKSKVASVSIADANFGIFPRDVDFAREAARLKRETGYPRGFGGNYAKNTVKYLRNIIDVLAEGDILTLGTLSLQSMDQETLDAINRSNIKTEKYDALAVEMRNARLPLTIELMMGLPGATVDSFREDLQQCIDRELPVRVNMTTLLVNSPMNHPDYLAAHEITTHVPVAPGNLATLASTSSYTSEDLTYMSTLRETYMLFENYGALRILSRYVHQETGSEEMRFYEKLMSDSNQRDEWPALYLLWNAVPSLMAPPVSWYLVLEEMGRYLAVEYGIADSPARRSILAAQLACLPAHDRVFPEVVELECDVSAWFDALLAEKERGNRRDWPSAVPRLETFGPGTLTVDDPHGITRTALGINREINVFGVNWELESPLHRARADLV